MASPFLKIFVEEIPGGAITEELFLFLAFCVGYVLFRRSALLRPVDIVTMAVSVAIGFTTVENAIAVLWQIQSKWKTTYDPAESGIAESVQDSQPAD